MPGREKDRNPHRLLALNIGKAELEDFLARKDLEDTDISGSQERQGLA